MLKIMDCCKEIEMALNSTNGVFVSKTDSTGTYFEVSVSFRANLPYLRLYNADINAANRWESRLIGNSSFLTNRYLRLQGDQSVNSLTGRVQTSDSGQREIIEKLSEATYIDQNGVRRFYGAFIVVDYGVQAPDVGGNTKINEFESNGQSNDISIGNIGGVQQLVRDRDAPDGQRDAPADSAFAKDSADATIFINTNIAVSDRPSILNEYRGRYSTAGTQLTVDYRHLGDGYFRGNFGYSDSDSGYGDSALNPPSSVAHACLRGDRGRLWLRCAP
jgi:hypothetical protein